MAFWGIDVGTSSIKVVQLSKERNRVKLDTYGQLETYAYAERFNDAIQTSSLKMLDSQVADLIKKLLRESKAVSRDVTMSIPIFSSFSTVIEIPPIPEKELERAIPFEARQYVPIPLAEVVLDWTIMKAKEEPKVEKPKEKEKKDEEKKAEEAKAEEKKAAEKKEEEERGREIKSPRLQILLTAVPKEVITKYNRITKLAGLNLRGLEVETAASVRSILGNDKSTVLLMDFGARSTNINVIYNGYPVMSHSIDTAGFDLTKVLSQGMGVSLRRAEDLKKERGLKAGLAEAEMISIMTPLVDKIFTETERIVNIYVRRTGKRLDRVVILGGGALLPGVEEYVSLRLGLPAVTGNSFARVIYPPILEPMIKEIGPMFSVAMGLGMREIV
ncbi:MAG: Type IV pilus biogenesis protein PilM [Candidatus Azambacteria bacterium GW2011_GWE2_46_45]|uniref:Type IV pilus biogenesis protein PilM n=2 Tax=Candidatus Azamiibacteriota TaxID=1752741 RepID=A0A0G1Q404_9BACT|nr:MAG: Type IV pilus biogenesis protein PilM [Candidatus Azambacteria bacterium GW2011_GWE2_46_45]